MLKCEFLTRSIIEIQKIYNDTKTCKLKRSHAQLLYHLIFYLVKLDKHEL